MALPRKNLVKVPKKAPVKLKLPKKAIKRAVTEKSSSGTDEGHDENSDMPVQKKRRQSGKKIVPEANVSKKANSKQQVQNEGGSQTSSDAEDEPKENNVKIPDPDSDVSSDVDDQLSCAEKRDAESDTDDDFAGIEKDTTLSAMDHKVAFTMKFKTFTSKTSGDPKRGLLLGAFQRFFNNDLEKLKIFFKDDQTGFAKAISPRPTDVHLSSKQASCAALMRLVTHALKSYDEEYIWNMLCALRLKTAFQKEKSLFWRAYQFKKAGSEDHPYLNKEERRLTKEQVVSLRSSINEKFSQLSDELVNGAEEIFMQIITIEKGEYLGIGTLTIGKMKSKTKITSSSVYAVNPKMPYIFTTGEKSRELELNVLMRCLDPEYEEAIEINVTDQGLSSLASVCFAPPPEKELDLDKILEQAEEDAKEEAEQFNTLKYPSVISGLKREKFCKKVMEECSSFRNSNQFLAELVNNDGKQIGSVMFRSKSGNIPKMIGNMCAAGMDPTPFIQARGEKKGKAKITARKPSSLFSPDDS